MKKLLPVCMAAMIFSVTAFANPGAGTSSSSSTSPSETSMESDTSVGSGSTMTTPSTTPAPRDKEERMEEQPNSGATQMGSGTAPVDSMMDPPTETDTDSTAP